MTKELTQENIGMDRISPSGLDCYEQCPKLFYYTNWLKLRLEQDKRHMDFGTAIHEALRWVYLEYDNHFGGAWEAGDFKHVKDAFNKFWTPKMVTQQSFENYKSTRAGRESLINSPMELYNYMKKDGYAMLKSYWHDKGQMLVDYDYDLTDFEVIMRTKICNPENMSECLPIPLSMRIDAINRDKTKIVDFKTSGHKYNEEETRKMIQGQCYVFGHLMKTGELIRKMDYIVLRKELKSENRIEVVQLEYDEADMMALYIRIKTILHKIVNREFAVPNIGHSQWCQCGEFEEKLKVD